MDEPRKNSYAFFFSIFTAVIVGVSVAFVGISGVKLAQKFILSPKSVLALVDSAPISVSPDPVSTAPLSSKISNQATSTGVEVIESLKDSILPNPPSRKSRDQAISATSYIVTNMDTNDVLLQKDSNHLLPIASVTKLVTAVIAKKLIDKNKQIVITAPVLSTYGDTAHLRLGEKYTLNEILYPLLMVSSNDVAEAIAQSYGRDKFISEMNLWVNSIGAYGTYFNDPSGLSPQNVSTARDIAIIAGWIEKNMPEIFDITHTKSKTIRVHTWTNPTHFLNVTAYVGGKNGYTPEADRTGVALFKLGTPEHLYSVVLLGSSQRDGDTLDVLDKALK